MNSNILVASFLAFLFIKTCHPAPPNIVFILTDDQDVVLKTPDSMPKVKKLIGDAGITFENMFVTSPLCCPSRSSILTGRYVHNHKAVNNSVSGGCSSTSWQKTAETKSFVTYIKEQGYRTFFAGKYLNQYGYPEVGGVEHVPPGWDEWNGLQGNSVYYNYNLSVNGKAESHGANYKTDYLTDVINRKATQFLDTVDPFLNPKPFFMMLSTPACHAPFTPAPQYAKEFSNVTAPRDASFNYQGKDKHWLLRVAKHPLSNVSLTYIDDTYRDRWRTLQSVDDMVENVYNILSKKDLLDKTYLFFSSDNGYHLGQFSLPSDKRQLYEFDIRVPLMVSGPGIKAGQVRKETLVSIDLGPTFIDLTGVTPPNEMDGISFRSLFNATSHLDLRTDFLVEHSGEHADNNGCPATAGKPLANCHPDCVCEDAANNTYTCVRRLSASQNLMYCGFRDAEKFIEVYDLSSDPSQLTNVVNTIDKQVLAGLSRSLGELAVCSGPSCRLLPPYL